LPDIHQPDNRPAAGKMSVLAISDVNVLRKHWAALEDLSSTVAEPNVFLEPWMVIPAVEAFGADKTFTFLLIFAEDSSNGGKRLLCGFFPFERRRMYARMPARFLLLWGYKHCGVCTPLLRLGHEKACLEALIDWADSNAAGADIIEWFQVSADGPIFKGLLECLEHRRLRHSLARRDRPLMVPRDSAEVFLNEALSSNRKRGLRRWERQLSEFGEVAYKEIEDGDINTWIDEYFVMEDSGWKGREGVAAIRNEKAEGFIRYALREAFRRNQLLTLSMTVGGTPAASRFILTSRHAAFGYKTSYEERYARFSPGSLLEIESIRRIHQHPEIRWLDSCTAASFSHYLPWLDKLSVADIAFSTGSLRGNGVLAVAPALRSLRQTLVRWKQSAGKKPVNVAPAQPDSGIPPA
jgi:CelD/BcsL family acetyltransferase involved in cellulose biosynthesis